jgi:4-amino-4-deoxy-L-arabinose transferase-like glycosyltransferase
MPSDQPVAASPVDPLARYARWGLLGVLLVALALRLWGIRFGLPYVEHPDEPYWIFGALKMIQTGDLNPHDFIYPSFYFYPNVLAFQAYYGVGRLLGDFHSVADLVGPTILIGGSGFATMPGMILIGRILPLALGVATVAFTYDLGRRLTGFVLGGVLAGLWVAVSPLLVANSRYMIPDGPMVFFTTLAVWGAWGIYERGRTRDYLMAGIAVGLAVGTKYNAAPFALAIVLAHFLRPGSRPLTDWRLYASLAVSAAAFLLTTPYALLDYQAFANGAFIDVRHYTGGHDGFTGGSLAWYFDLLWHREGPMLVLAGAGAAWGLYRRDRGVILIAGTALAYLISISVFAVHFERSVLPLIPLMALLSAWWAVRAGLGVAADRSRAHEGAVAALVVIALAFPLVVTVHETVRLNRIDGRDTARAWMDENLTPGARVALESYSPWVDPQKSSVLGLFKLTDHDLAWYQENGYNYLVFSQRMFYRFYAEPDRYREEIARYGALLAACDELKVFTDGGYEVRVCRLPQAQQP